MGEVSDSIIIDGFIEDFEWTNAEIVENFVEINPGINNSPALARTQVRVTYDNKNLYVAFNAYDDIKLIRANQSKRDDIANDDRIIVSIDPRNDGVVEHYFSCNPYGNQLDGQKFANSERDNWDAIWYSSGRIRDDGYEVEMAIPFSTFRSASIDEFHWRINFFRFIPRKESIRIDSWVPIDRDNICNPCQFGHLRGIKNIDIKSPIAFLPSLVGSYQDSFSNNFGFGISLPLGKTITTEITLNPDFSQVESNETKIDINSRTAISYPETRPFFNEGIDLFNTGSFGWKPKVRAVYTRSINQPKVAAKMLGQRGNTQFGYLGSLDQNGAFIVPFTDFGGTTENLGETHTNIFRLKHSINEGSYIGGLLSDRRYDGGVGTSGGVDGLYRFNNNLQLDYQFFLSKTIEPYDSTISSSINGYFFGEDLLTSDFDGEEFSGHSLYISLDNWKNNRGMTFLYAEVSPTFRVDNGYIDFNDRRQIVVTSGGNFFPKNSLYETMSFWFGTGRVFSYDWAILTDWIYLSHDGQMIGQFVYGITLFAENEYYRGLLFEDNYGLEISFRKSFSKKVSLNLIPQFGTEIIRVDEPYQARNISFGFELNLRPTNEFKFSFKLNQSRSIKFDNGDEVYSDFIARSRFEYQATDALNFRLVNQYHDYYETFDLQPLVSYQPGTILYFLYWD
ncbi:MAG: sugar-binding protein [Candidatus Neomarinimicrobiota bacterium]